MLSLDQIWAKSPEDKKTLIEDARVQVAVPPGLDMDLHAAYQYSRVLNGFIEGYILRAADKDIETGTVLETSAQSHQLDVVIDEFYPKALAELKKALPDEGKLKQNAKNLYEVAGARKLAFGNNATRTLSTTMGLLWEKLANISPYAVNPELEFGIKVKGVDIVFYDLNEQKVFFAQLKTQQNTLTGSQKGRSVSELLLHENPAFCACFETKSSWTFSHQTIPRFMGKEFWLKIGMDYALVENKVSALILRLENDYVEILNRN